MSQLLWTSVGVTNANTAAYGESHSYIAYSNTLLQTKTVGTVSANTVMRSAQYLVPKYNRQRATAFAMSYCKPQTTMRAPTLIDLPTSYPRPTPRRCPVLFIFLAFVCGLQLAYVIIFALQAMDSSGSLNLKLGGGPNSNLFAFRTSQHHPLFSLVQSYPVNPRQDAIQRRTVLSLTVTPAEMDRLQDLVKELLHHHPYAIFDAIHLSIPHQSSRFPDQPYPSLETLQTMFNDSRIVLNRLHDYGPLTRYLGPLAYEQHPDTAIVIIDIDSQGMDWQIRGRSYQRAEPVRDLVQLVEYAQALDQAAMWCLQGEDFAVESSTTAYNDSNITTTLVNIKAVWDTFPMHKTDDNTGVTWNLVHFCRGVGGVVFRPRQLVNFWYNNTAYHESCNWDDDRWVSFQMEQLGVQRKALHLVHRDVWTTKAPSKRSPPHGRRLGSLSGLTKLNAKLHSDQTCTKAWLKRHNTSFPTARVGLVDRIQHSSTS
jgi:hypothetical protein